MWRLFEVLARTFWRPSISIIGETKTKVKISKNLLDSFFGAKFDTRKRTIDLMANNDSTVRFYSLPFGTGISPKDLLGDIRISTIG